MRISEPEDLTRMFSMNVFFGNVKMGRIGAFWTEVACMSTARKRDERMEKSILG